MLFIHLYIHLSSIKESICIYEVFTLLSHHDRQQRIQIWTLFSLDVSSLRTSRVPMINTILFGSESPSLQWDNTSSCKIKQNYHLIAITWLSIAFVVTILGPFTANRSLNWSPLSLLPSPTQGRSSALSMCKTSAVLPRECYTLGQFLAFTLLNLSAPLDTALMSLQDTILSWLLFYLFFIVFVFGFLVCVFYFVLLDPSYPMSSICRAQISGDFFS